MLLAVWGQIVALGQAPAPAPAGADPTEAELFRPSAPALDPAVQAILATNPVLPWECARAAKILSDLGEHELAKGFLQKILNELASLPEAQRRETLVDFDRRFGSPMFFDMALRPQLAPAARQLAEMLAEALEAHRRDPDRLTRLVQQLADENPRLAVEAAEELRLCGSFAVWPLVQALSRPVDLDPARAPDFWRRSLSVFRKLGPDAYGPLQAILEGNNAAAATVAAQLVAALSARELASSLLVLAWKSDDPALREAAGRALIPFFGKRPEPEAAAAILVNLARQKLETASIADSQTRQSHWFWDPNVAAPTFQSLPQPEVIRRQALRWCEDALRLDPANLSAEILAAIAQAELGAPSGSVGEIAAAIQRLTASWSEKSLGRLLQILVVANHLQMPVAAAVTLGVIGQRAGEQMIFANHVDPSPLVQCLRHPDRRIRYFAVRTVLQHASHGQFAGASWVWEAVGYFLATEGKRRVLLATANTEDAMRIAGFLIPQGYEIETARTGREVFRLLSSSPDFELAFIDVAIEDPAAPLLLQQLRGDCRTATLPIGLLARAGSLDRAKQLASGDPKTQAFSRPHDQESARWQVAELKKLDAGALLSPQERVTIARDLLQQLSADLERISRLIPLGRLESVWVFQLQFADRAPAAISILAHLGTPGAQTALVEYASRPIWPVELRRQAAAAFAQSISRHTILLTTKQINRQYELYNQFGPTSAVEREILGSLLDAMEEQLKTDEPAALSTSLIP